ncbi:MAG: major capsid family protein, partial [Ktedonobacteraceae bacterium]
MDKIVSVNLDAGETAFFARELEYIKSKSYDIEFPPLKAIKLIPVSTEAGAGAESITYQSFEETGLARIISSYADDFPRCDIRGKEFITPVKSIGASYGYSMQEIRAAMFVGRSLTQRQA